MELLHRYINRPHLLFDPFKAIELLEALVRVARRFADEKADEYAAVLDEVKARNSVLPHASLLRLMLGLLGNPVRAQVAKDSAIFEFLEQK